MRPLFVATSKKGEGRKLDKENCGVRGSGRERERMQECSADTWMISGILPLFLKHQKHSLATLPTLLYCFLQSNKPPTEQHNADRKV